jgi:hypothetical protein
LDEGLAAIEPATSTELAARTDTVTRPSTLREYARAAGFRDIEALPFKNDFWHFFRSIQHPA